MRPSPSNLNHPHPPAGRAGWGAAHGAAALWLGMLCLAVLGPAVLFAPAAIAQPPQAKELPLYERAPYDVLYVNGPDRKEVAVKVAPLKLEPRRPPSPENWPQGKLVVRPLSKPGEKYEIAWSNIKRVELFEQLILREAEQLVAQNKFDEAYGYYDDLLRRHPNTPGLERSRQEFLYRQAGAWFAQGEFSLARAALEELHALNPKFTFQSGQRTVPLADTMQFVAARELQSLLEGVANPDYGAARRVLTRLARRYPADSLPAVDRWRARLKAQASAEMKKAHELIAAGKLREARGAAEKMTEIWPKLEGAAQLWAELDRRYPVLRVAVGRISAATHDTAGPPIDDWHARRAERLRFRRLVEFAGYGPTGQRYQWPLARFEPARDLSKVRFTLVGDASDASTALTGYDWSRRLREFATRRSRTSAKRPPVAGGILSRLLKSVHVTNVLTVEAQLAHPHARPEALFSLAPMPPAEMPKQAPFAPYHLESATNETANWVINDRYRLAGKRQPKLIQERIYPDAAAALRALRRGEIDAVDRISPGDLRRIQAASDIRVIEYDQPTLFMLVPNLEHPLLANSTFRRGLAYAINRERILESELVPGVNLEGVQVVTGPFPAGRSENDAAAIGYDRPTPVRQNNPALAAMLLAAGRRQAAESAAKKGNDPPALKQLVIAHRDDPWARRIGAAIIADLQRVGLECRLKPLAAESSEREFDLLLVEAAPWDPPVDAERLLGAQGALRNPPTLLRDALMRLSLATGADVQSRLKEIHRLCHAEAIVLPLWQVYHRAAVRSTWKRPAGRPLRFYDGIEQWAPSSAQEVAGR